MPIQARFFLVALTSFALGAGIMGFFTVQITREAREIIEEYIEVIESQESTLDALQRENARCGSTNTVDRAAEALWHRP